MARVPLVVIWPNEWFVVCSNPAFEIRPLAFRGSGTRCAPPCLRARWGESCLCRPSRRRSSLAWRKLAT